MYIGLGTSLMLVFLLGTHQATLNCSDREFQEIHKYSPINCNNPGRVPSTSKAILGMYSNLLKYYFDQCIFTIVNASW